MGDLSEGCRSGNESDKHDAGGISHVDDMKKEPYEQLNERPQEDVTKDNHPKVTEAVSSTEGQSAGQIKDVVWPHYVNDQECLKSKLSSHLEFTVKNEPEATEKRQSDEMGDVVTSGGNGRSTENCQKNNSLAHVELVTYLNVSEAGIYYNYSLLSRKLISY